MIKMKRIMGFFLAMILTVGMVMNVSATNIKQSKDKAESIEAERDKAAAEKQSLADKVKDITESMSQMESEIDEKRVEIEKAEQELVMSRIREQEQHESMKYRIRYMYEHGNGNFFEVLLESKSITDFLNKAEYITKMSEYDREQLKSYQQTVRAVENKEELLQAEYQELEQIQEYLIEHQATVEQLLKEKSEELASLDLELDQIKKQIERAEEEAKKRQEAANNDGGGTPQAPVVNGNGFFTHPCPGMTYQSSYFGEVRSFDPVPHRGVDYAAPAKTPIYAAAAGTVVIAGYSTSAGNWVVINHGNGLVSKYMHMYTTPFVKAGDTVVKGQHIGGVGTTGQSTGNHLHFQVELNGVPVNPANYM